ncbi:MAG TPA: 16S rRNA (adenine(1518)-N(6)/adenine(1519)-N(6))-dimethyltransferase RsmA, partial [Gemmatimonadales bacterium]|nr:16S rRNA (adenine(1518)-N(6)/adenine(1519)-N(6))-dimethyltransferase RsmA [Gemmatimonadales bacterium]
MTAAGGRPTTPPPEPVEPAPAVARPSELLARHGVRPNKRLGQNFLVDRAHLGRIVAAAELTRDDVVLEIGPGMGVLTTALAAQAGHVVAVEIDPGMRAVLDETLGADPRVTVVAADILEVAPGELVSGPLGLPPGTAGVAPHYKVVANLPYYITSAILRHVLEAPLKPSRVVVMVQREVADRMCARPGDMSLLAVAVQYFAVPRRVAIVPAGAFHPRPKVDSAVVALDVHASPPWDVPSERTFFDVARAGFGQRRKQLRNSLAAGLGVGAAEAAAWLEGAGIAPDRRAETLAMAEWAALAG